MLGLIAKMRTVHPDVIEVDVHIAAALLKIMYSVVLFFLVKIIM
jgi:hypothetical protein